MDLPYNWDFIQDNIPSEKLAKLRRRFMEEWRSGNYTKEEMIERYRIDEEYQEVVRTFDSTRKEVDARFSSFIENMHTDKRNLSPPKLKAQKKKIWDVRPGVRKIKAILDTLWASAKKAKTISKSYVHDLLKKFEKYPEEIKKENPKEFNNSDVTTVHEKKGISWIKVSKPWDNPFAGRGIRTIKYEYLNQVWIGNLGDFRTLSEVIKLHYNEYRPHQSFDNKTPMEVRIETTDKKHYLQPRKLEKWNAFSWTIPGWTKPAVC